MASGPLRRIVDELPDALRGIIERETPIPSIAQGAAAKVIECPGLVRADIGQISGLDASLEVLYGSPVGLDRARELVAESWNLTFGLPGRDGFGDGLKKANIAITTGAAEALANALRATASGHVVAIPSAHWENYLNGVEAAGGTAVSVEFFDERGDLDVDGLRTALDSAGAKVLLVNFPANPTGAVLSPDEAKALADLAIERDLIVVADEVYSRLRFDGVPPQSLLTYAPEHVISISSASKEYLIPGARVGYAISALPEVTDRVIRKLVRTSSGSPNVLGQERLIAMLEQDLADLRQGRAPTIFTRVLEEMKRRKQKLMKVLTKHDFHSRGRAGHGPEGTIFLMVGVPAWFDGGDDAFARATLEAGCVSCVPGSAFGMPNAVRFSYGGMTEEAIARLDDNLTRFRREQSQ